jgi:hypothetical protein
MGLERTSLEQDLHRVLTDDRHALPAWPDAAERVGAGVRRRRRRREAVIVSAIVVAAILLGVPVVLAAGRAPDHTPPIDQPTNGVIPWTDTPADPPSDLPRRDPRPDARPCTAADLTGSARFEQVGAAGGQVVNIVFLPNRSDTRCTLTGSATVYATDKAGRRVQIPARSGTRFDGGIKHYPATVDPAEPARLDIVTATGCNGGLNAIHYGDVVLAVAGHQFPVPGLVLETTCQLEVGSWYVLPPPANAPVTVTLDTPPQAHRGQPYRYTVTVLAGDQPFNLHPCPVYIQTLGSYVGTYRLNCAVATIAPHRLVTFAMTLNVPRDAPLGTAQLTWTAYLADGTVAIADLASGGASVEVVS